MRIVKWLIGLVVLLAAIYIGVAFVFFSSNTSVAEFDAVDSGLDREFQNGLSGELRQEFYHLSQGSEIFPFKLLKAIDDPATGEPFIANLERYGLLPDPDREDGLPVGLTLATNEFTAGVEMVGITCAACHVGEIRHNGKAVRIDGAPNMFDMQLFYADMIEAGLVLKEDSGARRTALTRLYRMSFEEYGVFAPLVRPIAIIGQAIGVARDQASLEARGELGQVIFKAIRDRDESGRCVKGSLDQPCTSGFGRLDAFNGSRNFVIGRFDDRNLVPLEAPVKFPPVWDFQDFDWFEWSSNTNSVMERNITETLGAGATVMLSPEHGQDRFRSSVPVAKLHRLEELAYEIEPPQWPEHVLGAIDSDMAAAGAELFGERCASCHVYGDADRTEAGLIRLRYFPVETIGTDARAFREVACPVFHLGDLQEVIPPTSFTAEDAETLAGCQGVPDPAEPFEAHAFADVVKTSVEAVKTRAYAEAGVSPEEQTEFEDLDRRKAIMWRDTILETGKPIAARPLHGVWATAPYLHNGSVPSLYDVLLPPSERTASFPIGHRDYDPKRVGYLTDVPEAEVGYIVDTGKPGNRNTGHYGALFGTEDLTEAQRWQLIEYLKTY